MIKLNKFYLKQDNDQKHISLILIFFEQNNVKLINHSSHSPSLNPMEQIWAYIKNELNKNYFNKKKN